MTEEANQFLVKSDRICACLKIAIFSSSFGFGKRAGFGLGFGFSHRDSFAATLIPT